MLQLRKFDASTFMPRGVGVVLIIGKRNAGKSFLVKDLLSRHRDIPFGTIVSPTESVKKSYSGLGGCSHPATLQVREDFDRDVIVRVMDRQETAVRQSIRGDQAVPSDPRAFLVLDNCMFNPVLLKDPAMRQLFSNARSYSTLFICTMPYPFTLPSIVRPAVDYVFVLPENTTEGNRLRLYRQYGGVFGTFEGFCQAMDQYCTDFSCLVFDFTARSNKLEDTVFWYTADEQQTFLGPSCVVGCTPLASRL